MTVKIKKTSADFSNKEINVTGMDNFGTSSRAPIWREASRTQILPLKGPIDRHPIKGADAAARHPKLAQRLERMDYTFEYADRINFAWDAERTWLVGELAKLPEADAVALYLKQSRQSRIRRTLFREAPGALRQESRLTCESTSTRRF